MTVIDLGVPSLGPAEPAPTSGPLVDTFGRIATDLRVSLTDRCNLRCTYCMPAEGLDWMPSEQLLRSDELARLMRIAVTRLGVTSVRFTGGEPLVAKHLETSRGDRLGPPRNHVDHQRHWADKRAAKLKRAGLTDQRLTRHRRRRTLRPHHPPRPAARLLAGLEAAKAAGLNR
jgi:cyclic pyranopterin phosphate synthase